MPNFILSTVYKLGHRLVDIQYNPVGDVCSCVNYEGPDRIEAILGAARRMRGSYGMQATATSCLIILYVPKVFFLHRVDIYKNDETLD